MSQTRAKKGHQPHPGWISLVSAVAQLSSVDSLASIIEIVRTTARDISGADGVTFVLREGDLCYYAEENTISPLWKGQRFPINNCIAGWCLLHDTPAVIPDIYADDRIPHDAYRSTFVKSLVMMPVRAIKPMAAIGFYWARTRDFDADEIALLEALGRSTSTAIAAAQLRETLRSSENRVLMALAAGGLGAWVLDLITGTLIATPAFKAIFGRAPDDRFTFEDVMRTVHREDRIQVRKIFDAANDLHPETEYRIVWPDGSERRIEMRGQAIVDNNGVPTRMNGVVRDVTERHRAQERLDRLQADLAHVARQNDMGEMASALAHEINQPLAAARNYMQTAEKLLEQTENKQAQSIVAKAEAQCSRAAAIIQRLRDFVGKGKIAKTPEDIGGTVAEVLELAHMDPRHRDVQLRVEIEDGLARAMIDKVQVQQVLLNLLRNACEAMEGRERREVVISACGSDDTKMIEVRVADTGPGLAPEIAAHLFEPFHTTKNSGMGVGLSLCRSIVEAHGGKMWNEPGEGATFCFTLAAA
ncbi:MAG: ATP-binding protein [Rhizomicrobium sp.]